MIRSLRSRLLLSHAPFVALLAAVGVAGVLTLQHLGGRIDAIVAENAARIEAMTQLTESLRGIDEAFHRALLRREGAAQQFDHGWADCDRLSRERAELFRRPGEPEMTGTLAGLFKDYRAAGDKFFARPANDPAREADYFAPDGGLASRYAVLKDWAAAARKTNEDAMRDASDRARRSAEAALFWFGAGLSLAIAVAGLLTWRTHRSIVAPIEQLKASVDVIGKGDLGRDVPVTSADEIGELAQSFNTMTHRLRDLRESHSSRLVRARQTSQATIDSFPDPVVVLDPEGRVEMANPSARRLLGVAPPDTESRGPGQEWHPPGPMRRPIEDALRHQTPYLAEGFDQAVTFHLGGKDLAFLPQVLPIRDPYGATLGAAVVLDDVTRFRVLDQMKSDLVATVSHELKTPLTSVRLGLHLLLEETVGPLEPKQVELLTDARDNAERLLKMIENLLAMAQLKDAPDKLGLHPGDVREVAAGAAEEYGPRAADASVELVAELADSLPAVALDPAKLSTALGNLLDNALAHTPTGGTVTLRAEAAETGGVVLSVADTGTGIPAEYLPRVFERFLRVPRPGRAGGTGLGLAIARDIVNAHGGTIACTSTPGKGTTFTIILPPAAGDAV